MTDHPRTGARILVRTPNWVGDVVMATPAFRGLRRRFPRAHITFLARSYLQELLEPCPWCDEIISADEEKTLGGLRRLARRLQEQDYRLAVLFPNSFRSALLVWLAGIPRRVGYGRDCRTFLLSEPLHVPRDEKGSYLIQPMVTYYAEIVAHLGAEVEDRRPCLAVDPAARESLHQLLSTIGYDPGKPTAVFVPGAKFGSSKCWPPRHFARLAEMMLQEMSWNLIVVCGPGEEAIGEEIEQLAPPGVINLWREPIGLGRLKALVAESALLVTNDTGPRHFASAFDVPVVSIFGPTPQELTDTCHAREVALQLTDLECVPCQLPACPRSHECLEDLLPERVLAAVAGLIERYPPRRPVGAAPPKG